MSNWAASMTVDEGDLLARAVRAHGVPMLVVDPEGGAIVWANDAVAELYDRPYGALAGMTLVDLHAVDREAVRRNLAGARSTRGGRLELPLRRRDGAERVLRFETSPVEFRGRSLLLGLIRDVTAEHHEAGAAASQTTARFRELFEAHTAVMLLVDPSDGAVVDGNHAAARFYGYDRATLRRMKIHEINTEDPAAVAEDMRSASLAQRNTFLFEHRLASGERRTVEVSSTLVEFGGRDLLFSIIQDVTAREEARAALVRERQRYRSFMDIAQDGIHLLDKDGNLIEANRSFLRMIGATEAAVGRLNVHDWDVGIPRDKLGARVKELIEQPGLFETRHRHTEGTVIDVEVHAGAIELDGERFQLASSRDITPRKLVEKELAVKQLQLEELNRSLEARIQRAVDELRAKDQILITQNRHAAMGEVIGNVAHQWRQPLHTLAMLIANVRDASRAGELDAAAIERAASDATRLLQRMSSTINDFRDFLMPDKERRPFSVVKQVNDAVRLLDATFGDAGIRVDVAAPEDATVFGYANEYSQVVVNLLTNARQAIQSTRKEHGCVSIQLSSDASEAVLTVRDNGGGVPGDLLDRIFEPYFSTKLGGTGLGLYMSRGLVERNLGGILEARNVDGGAEFLIRTPIARPQPGAVGRRDSRRPAAAPARPRKRARQRGPLE